MTWLRAANRRRVVHMTAAGLVCVLVALGTAGCASLGVPEPATTTDTTTTRTATVTPGSVDATPVPLRLHGEPARAAGAVGALSRALRDGDVEGLCEPDAIFTAAVITDIESNGGTCEAIVETWELVRRPAPLTVVGLAFRPDLAVAQVSVGGGAPVALDLARAGAGWLVSFGRDAVNPVDALVP